MKLTRESAYGLDGLLVLAAQPPGTTMQLSEIAAQKQLPESFLAKIFQKLAQHGVVRSFRGSVRGYALARSNQRITLQDILLATEGQELFERCIFWSDRCETRHPCPLHEQWQTVSKPLTKAFLGRTTLADLLHNESARPRKARALGEQPSRQLKVPLSSRRGTHHEK